MLPIWGLMVIAATLALLARVAAIYPSRRLVVWCLGPAVLAVGLVVLPSAWPVVLAVDVLVALAGLGDLFTIARPWRLSAERHMGVTGSLQKQHPVSLLIVSRSPQHARFDVRDGVAQELAASPASHHFNAAPHSRTMLRYALRPTRRGAFTIDTCHVRIHSRWGLWAKHVTLPCQSKINVYPNMRQLDQYALLARADRLSLLGVRRSRRIGSDNEFERLRDYTVDDNYRRIDWRATARRNRLTVKDFQTNQSQRLMLLVDCGRMMASEHDGATLLDGALDAALMLSFVALRQNDQVGMLCFSNDIHAFVPPRGGRGQMNRLLHAAFDRFPQMVESRYDEAFSQIVERVRKRTLVVLITNIVDEVNAQMVTQRLAALGHRHLPLLALLKDHALCDPVERVAPQLRALTDTSPREALDVALLPDDTLFRSAAAAEILTWRHRVLTDLASRGVLLVDSYPEQLTAPLVNRYLDVKARHLL